MISDRALRQWAGVAKCLLFAPLPVLKRRRLSPSASIGSANLELFELVTCTLRGRQACSGYEHWVLARGRQRTGDGRELRRCSIHLPSSVLRRLLSERK